MPRGCASLLLVVVVAGLVLLPPPCSSFNPLSLLKSHPKSKLHLLHQSSQDTPSSQDTSSAHKPKNIDQDFSDFLTNSKAPPMTDYTTSERLSSPITTPKVTKSLKTEISMTESTISPSENLSTEAVLSGRVTEAPNVQHDQHNTQHLPSPPEGFTVTSTEHPFVKIFESLLATELPAPVPEDHYHDHNTQNSVLGSLFELAAENEVKVHRAPETMVNVKVKGTGLQDLLSTSAVGEVIQELHNMTFLHLVSTGATGEGGNRTHAESALLKYLDDVRGGAWGQFKAMAIGYSNWLEHEYKLQNLTQQLPLDLVKKVLDLGDKVNFLHVVGKRVDPGLAKFLADQMQPLFNHFDKLKAGHMLTGHLKDSVSAVVRDAAWKTLHQFVNHVLRVSSSVVSREEIENFQKDLAKTSPLAAQGLSLILNGPPELPTSGAAEGRSMGRKGYVEYHDGHYGGYGAYDDSYSSYGAPVHQSGYGGGMMGYGAGVHLDPYLILAGLGAAVLLAYLAYRVIVTTAASERRANMDAFSLVDLSDVPGVVHSLHSLLDDAMHKYESKRSVSHGDDWDDLALNLNSLWRARQDDTAGCTRCSLFSFALDYAEEGEHYPLQSLVVSGVAHLLGTEGSGQLVDQVVGQVLEGHDVTCRRIGHTCDVE